MGKINRLLIAVFFLISCTENSERRDYASYNFIFNYNPWLTIDFRSKILKVELGDFKYSDQINFTDKDEMKIVGSFKHFRINKITGKLLFAEEQRTMPPSDFQIKVLLNKEIRTELTIDNDYNKRGIFPFSERYRVISFRNDILKVLNSKKEIKKAMIELLRYKRENNLFEL